MLSKKYLIVFAIITLIPIIVTAIVYPSLPEIIPTHFNANDIADAYGGKGSVWIISVLFFVVNLFMLGITLLGIKLNSNKYSIYKIKSTLRVIMAATVLMSYISLVLLYGTAVYNEENPLNFNTIIFSGTFIVAAYSIYEEIKVRKLEKQFKQWG